ncbi:hypothetical protein N026_21025 [Pseudomonas syringae UB303]|uniref:Uncharacterized protein n=1 Tax=Pseudomonas syringae UB303 TaxID=1357287 RepID=A0AAJ4E5R1_PSESX|nr:hypothetical protein N026_21025 [Pseudomonas syringae UB303]
MSRRPFTNLVLTKRNFPCGVFGVGHLLHQASRRLRSDVLPNLEVFPIVSLVKASLAI